MARIRPTACRVRRWGSRRLRRRIRSRTWSAARFARCDVTKEADIAAAVDLAFEVKRRLLEMRTPSERIALLLELLPPLAAEATVRARVHSRAQGNGKGGPHPDIAIAT